jgi:hypothetical protein
MWLRDGLANDLKAEGVRVLTYGYDSHLVQNKSFQNIEDVASTFRVALSAIRRTGHHAMPRPLVFIAHSLGGIVLKEVRYMPLIIVEFDRWKTEANAQQIRRQ